MGAKANPYCPLKFTSKTITQDGFVRKATCECEEALCGWWHTEKSKCVVFTLAENLDVAQKLERAKLRLLLASGEDREAVENLMKSYPFLEAQRDIRAALE